MKTYQDQNKPTDVRPLGIWILNAQNAKDIIGSLPKGSHYDHPTVFFSVDDGLHKVRGSRGCKENCEKDSGAKARAEIPCYTWVMEI